MRGGCLALHTDARDKQLLEVIFIKMALLTTGIGECTVEVLHSEERTFFLSIDAQGRRRV